ncbi:uncharacterized protein [Antedon mediterranea]|uniref:uncharacterized protein n=1 Tax=Antedon mediterranea TaxID=105859 RepID=UPI003AF9588C
MADKQTKQVRVMLWMIPRTLSTVILKCMSQLENVKIISEPYTCAMMLGPERIVNLQDDTQESLDNTMKTAADIDLDMGLDHNLFTFKWVKETLLEGEYPDKDVIFCKDMSQPVSANHALVPKGYRHTFVIRHPLKLYKSWNNMFASIGKADGNLDEVLLSYSKGYSYGEHLELYEYLISSGIEPEPIIIDSDDLQSNPEGVLKKFCQTLGIKYTDKLLSWDAGDDIVKTWAASKLQLQGNKVMKVYQNAFDSTGFKPPGPLPQRSDLPDAVLRCVDATMPIYQQMYEKRLRP